MCGHVWESSGILLMWTGVKLTSEVFHRVPGSWPSISAKLLPDSSFLSCVTVTNDLEMNTGLNILSPSIIIVAFA